MGLTCGMGPHDDKKGTTMHVTYDIEDVFSLSDLTDLTMVDPRLTYLHNRFLNDLQQYQTFCETGDVHVAAEAKCDARDDLTRLLIALDDTFSNDDADFLLGVYIPEFMGGWTY